MILGLDLATRCTGVVVGDGASMPAVGVWKFGYCGEDLGQLLDDFDCELNKLSARFRPTIIIYESPILLPSDKLLTLRKIYAMGAYTELWAKRHGARCEEVSAKAIKKAVTGKHNASKDEVLAIVKRLGVPLPTGEEAKDAADAWGAWYVGLQHHAKHHVTAWDQALFSRRGYLA